MNTQDKELLFKDLSMRLPHHVYIQAKGYSTPIGLRHLSLDSILSIRPYLRPMSSMTEEEKTEFRKFITWIFDCNYQANTLKEVLNGNEIETDYIVELFDWLNAHHFDYRGLIPIGLALEAKEWMYKIE